MFRLIQLLTDRLISMFSRSARFAFHDKAGFPWIQRVEAAWFVVRGEFDGCMRNLEKIPNVEDISEDGNLGADRQPMSKGAEWKWFFLFGYGHKIEANCAQCPETTRLVESIPGMQGAIFAVLAPGKHIPPHRGLYKGLLRFHLGVRVPGPEGACRIRVGDETRPWVEGQGLIFDDTHTHEVWNDSTESRVVLMIDVERPLAAPLAAFNRLVLHWISSTRYITDAIDRVRSATSLVDHSTASADLARTAERT